MDVLAGWLGGRFAEAHNTDGKGQVKRKRNTIPDIGHSDGGQVENTRKWKRVGEVGSNWKPQFQPNQREEARLDF